MTKEVTMVNRASFAFVHHQVTNLFKSDKVEAIQALNKRLGASHYFARVDRSIDKDDRQARNWLAEALLVVGFATKEPSYTQKASRVWEELLEHIRRVEDMDDSFNERSHYYYMLGRATLSDGGASLEKIRIRIVELIEIREQIQDVERAALFDELVQRLQSKYQRRCKE